MNQDETDLMKMFKSLKWENVILHFIPTVDFWSTPIMKSRLGVCENALEMFNRRTVSHKDMVKCKFLLEQIIILRILIMEQEHCR